MIEPQRGAPGVARDGMLLLSVYSLSQWTLIRETIRRLLAAAERAGVVCTGSPETASAVEQEAAALGVPFFDQEELTTQALSRPLSKRERRRLAVGAWPPSDTELGYRRVFAEQSRAARHIVEESRARLVIVCEDGPGGNNALIAEAKRRGLPVLITPFGIGESRDYDNFLEDKHQEGTLNVLADGPAADQVRTSAPRWIRKTRYGEVTLFPAEAVLARVAENLDLPSPWTVHGGHADRLICESSAMRRHYEREGVPRDKLVDGGTVYCDVVYDALQSDRKYSSARESLRTITPGRTSILVALPPSYHATRGRFSEFSDYPTLCRAVFDLLHGLPNADVTVSLHPNARPDQKTAVRQTGAACSDEWLVSLIPRHDLLLTAFSSTIRWAIACSKPVVNYDIYKFALPTYDGVGGVFTSTRFADVKTRLARLVTEPSVYGEAAALQAKCAGEWGALDGKNFSRIHERIKSLTHSREPIGAGAASPTA